MATRNPQQVAQDWASRLAASGDKITQGVQSVTVAPGQAAARQADVWASNTQAAKAKFTRNVAAVPLESWKSATIDKGVQRIATGAQAAQPKFADFMSQFLPHVERVVSGLPKRGTFEQNIARMTANAKGMHDFRKNG